jgi:hypothetical protein
VGQSLEIAERAYVLENGSVRFSGKPDELLGSDELRAPTWACEPCRPSFEPFEKYKETA